MSRGCEVSNLTERYMARQLGFWGEFSGGITKIEICRLAAYLNNGLQATLLRCAPQRA